ncbi:unnamed protein product [Haemonchus placei]|uniref:tRNA-binding domain-containing protein n=1 Tax=Haemonchus placei TaxID=6290 RepID=A0A0N4WJF7_HAEPC|nr:unnamed protein product [Haemonchus placei]
MLEEDLVRVEVHLQDLNKPATTSTSGVTGGLIGAIRRTSDAFTNTLHLIAAPTQEVRQGEIVLGKTMEILTDGVCLQSEVPPLPVAETPLFHGPQNKERRMSDVEHLWKSAEKIHGF